MRVDSRESPRFALRIAGPSKQLHILIFQENPCAHKNKIGAPPPPNPKSPPPETRNLMGMEVSCRKSQKISGAHTTGAAISGPRIAGENFTDMRILLKGSRINYQGRKNTTNINFLVWFPADIPEPYVRMPRRHKVFPHHQGRRKTHFSVRTSMIFGADVHDPKGHRRTSYKKVCVVFGL